MPTSQACPPRQGHGYTSFGYAETSKGMSRRLRRCLTAASSNPPWILLHGGPGLSETAFFRHFNAPLERSFTAVYWDQRRAGKSFDRNIAPSSMTDERFIADLDELVDAVCKRLGKTKVAIFGHSWGSALGVLDAARFPAKVGAYVGSGQPVAAFLPPLALSRRVEPLRGLRGRAQAAPPTLDA
jgi:pimeloyl-ACP methyl ester carboxylesterase